MDRDKPSFYPQPPHPHFDAELYRRAFGDEITVKIDEVSGMQVVVITKKDEPLNIEQCLK